mgnify:CR=1 FL=1
MVNGKVLVVRRSQKEKFLAGHYELPVGKVDFSEHPEQSLKREFMEEVNLDVEVKNPFRIFTYVSHKGKRHTVDIVYMVRLNSDLQNLKLSEEHDDLKWVNIDTMGKVKMTDEMKTNIRGGFKLINN